MKSSKGIVVPVSELVRAVPPEVIRYLIVRVKPEKHIEFDPRFGLLEIIDSFEDELKQNSRNVQLSLTSKIEYSDVPFKHLVIVGQIAKWDLNSVLKILSRRYLINEKVKKDVERRLPYAKAWIEKYAPEQLKFEIKDKIEVMLDNDEIKFLKAFASKLHKGLKADDIHTLVYTVSKDTSIKPSKAFRAIYKVILGKKEGPRAGYFIESLGIEWVRNRILSILEKHED